MCHIAVGCLKDFNIGIIVTFLYGRFFASVIYFFVADSKTVLPFYLFKNKSTNLLPQKCRVNSKYLNDAVSNIAIMRMDVKKVAIYYKPYH